MQIFPSGRTQHFSSTDRLNQFSSIIFLDLDGVLNDEDASGEIDPVMAQHLENILQATGAGIVLSTGWRRDYRKKRLFAQSIPSFSQRYVGDTPDLGAESSFWSGDGQVNRWDEIESWLADSGFTGRYAVLDDRADMVREHPSFFHTVNGSQKGLTKGMSQRVIDHLQPAPHHSLDPHDGDEDDGY